MYLALKSRVINHKHGYDIHKVLIKNVLIYFFILRTIKNSYRLVYNKSHKLYLNKTHIKNFVLVFITTHFDDSKYKVINKNVTFTIYNICLTIH